MQIELLPYQPSFLAPYFAWRNEPASLRHNPLLPTSLEQLGRRLELEGSDLRDLATQNTFRWFVLVDGALAAQVSLQGVNRMMLTGEIGYQVGERFQGRGIATRAMGALVGKVFAETDLRKLYAHVHDENLASCRVLEKLGFRREGLLREHYLIRGQPVNEAFYGLLRREWATGMPSAPAG